MMCLPIGHGHEELAETVREQAGRFLHENSWYSNPQLIAFAEAITATLPDGLDVVSDKESKRPDAEMAECIRYNAALEGLIFICVKNFMRFCPPMIVTESEIDQAVAGLERAIKSALAGYPKNVDFRASSSLAAGEVRTSN